MQMNLPSWNSTLAWKKIGPYFIIMDPILNKQILTLNEVGEIIWNKCDGGHSLVECIDDLENKFSASREELEKDCLEFISILLKQGLLVSDV